jgi:CHASE3 domain sensor protein
MKIAQLIFFGFLFILLLFSFTTWINYRQTEAVKDNTEFVTRSTSVVRQGNRFQRNLLNCVSSLRAYFLTNDRTFIQTYDSARQENTAILRELIAGADTAQLASLNRIDALNQRWAAEFASVFASAHRTAPAGSDPCGTARPLYEPVPDRIQGRCGGRPAAGDPPVHQR